jgi:hypothetical protein
MFGKNHIALRVPYFVSVKFSFHTMKEFVQVKVYRCIENEGRMFFFYTIFPFIAVYRRM